MSDSVIKFGESERAALVSLRAAKKFTADFFYPGAPTEALRVEAESHVNTLIDRLLSSLTPNTRKSFVLGEFKVAMAGFTQSDSEERERFCSYLEQIMDITAIESSDGLLNSWVYGFDPNAL
jgi:hypothetical protein